jgi:subtilisin family serine protease
VNLQRVDASGRVIALLGTLNDAGLSGDLSSGDGIHTTRYVFTETTETLLRVRVSWALRGVLKRVVSDVLTLPVVSVSTIHWSPNQIELSLHPGTEQAFVLDFTADRDLSNTSIDIVPPLSSFLSVAADGLTAVFAGHSYSLTASLAVPADAVPGRYEGTVNIRSALNKVPDALKIVLNVTQPSQAALPSIAVAPSPDRITIDSDGQKVVKDELVLVLDFDTPDPNARIATIALATRGTVIGSVPDTLTYQLRYEVSDPSELEAIRPHISSYPEVVSISRHYLTDRPTATNPNDTEYDSWTEAQPGGNNWNLETIKAPSAWDLTTGDSSVVVAVIDGDFDRNHGDLDANVTSHNGPRTSSFQGHGTHVAGTICAEGNNSEGVAGVSWDCSLRLYEFGGASAVKAQEAMVKAVKDGARIVNMSLQWIDNNQCGTPGTAQTLQKVADNNAVLQRGILFALRENRDVLWVFAAGNECRDVKYASPASLTHNFPLNTIAVAAVTSSGPLSWFSNFGELVTVAAPGGDASQGIFSTMPRSCVLWIFCTDEYGPMAGTSMAAPHVSGLAALVLARNPDFSAQQIKQCIVAGAASSGAQVGAGHSFKVIHAPDAIECRGTVDLPAKVDLVFSLDLTGSTGSEIDRVKSEVAAIITNLRTTVSPSTDFRFAIVSYEDYAGYYDSRSCGSSYTHTYGAAGTKPGGDAPFRIDQALTSDAATVVSRINGLVLGYGGDGPQSYGRVFWEMGQPDTAAALGFRSDALKLLVNFGDNVPHDVDLNKDVASPPFTSPWDTGIDPGRNNYVDCGGDDIDFQDEALAALSGSGIRLIHIDSSGDPSLAPYWQFWTSVTGGAFAAINWDGTIPGGLNLTELIAGLLGLIH